MKAKFLLPLAAASMIGSASAVTIDLYEARSNVDGADADVSGSLDAQGLGTLSLSASGAGVHFLGLFVDHDIDEAINTYFNEEGFATGTPAAGQSWEIDEPGFVFGDIYDNFLDSGPGTSFLDNSDLGFADDISMALGWDVTLAAGETATASFTLSETAPTSGFYLTHLDPDSQAAVYFSSSLRISGAGVPEGGFTFIMLLMGMTGLGFYRHRLARRP